MEYSEDTTDTPTTVKARLPQLQAKKQLPFGGTPKRKKPSSSCKKDTKSAGCSLVEDSTSSGEDMNGVNLALTTRNTGWKSTNDVLLAEVAALKKQMEDI
jgi:hypothetical protein